VFALLYSSRKEGFEVLKTASLNIRIDPKTKADAEQLYAAFGITITDAVTMFLRQSLMVGSLPFELRQPRYNAGTEPALQECEEIPLNDKYGNFSYAKEMREGAAPVVNLSQEELSCLLEVPSIRKRKGS